MILCNTHRVIQVLLSSIGRSVQIVYNHYGALRLFSWEWIAYNGPLRNYSLTHTFRILSSESWHKGTNTSFLGTPVVHEERMTPGHCLQPVLWVSFRALTRFGDRKGIRPIKTCAINIGLLMPLSLTSVSDVTVYPVYCCIASEAWWNIYWSWWPSVCPSPHSQTTAQTQV